MSTKSQKRSLCNGFLMLEAVLSVSLVALTAVIVGPLLKEMWTMTQKANSDVEAFLRLHNFKEGWYAHGCTSHRELPAGIAQKPLETTSQFAYIVVENCKDSTLPSPWLLIYHERAYP